MGKERVVVVVVEGGEWLSRAARIIFRVLPLCGEFPRKAIFEIFKTHGITEAARAPASALIKIYICGAPPERERRGTRGGFVVPSGSSQEGPESLMINLARFFLFPFFSANVSPIGSFAQPRNGIKI